MSKGQLLGMQSRFHWHAWEDCHGLAPSRVTVGLFEMTRCQKTEPKNASSEGIRLWAKPKTFGLEGGEEAVLREGWLTLLTVTPFGGLPQEAAKKRSFSNTGLRVQNFNQNLLN
jgi:hypothetical protein